MFPTFPPADIAEANLTLLDLLARKQLSPVVAGTFPLAEAAEAQRHLIADRPYGRVLLHL